MPSLPIAGPISSDQIPEGTPSGELSSSCWVSPIRETLEHGVDRIVNISIVKQNSRPLFQLIEQPC
jgi:hypothetical protein